jgi:hypothetical protein
LSIRSGTQRFDPDFPGVGCGASAAVRPFADGHSAQQGTGNRYAHRDSECRLGQRVLAGPRLCRLRTGVRLRRTVSARGDGGPAAGQTPSYVAVVGKHRSYESGDRTNVAIEPEFVIPVDEETRDAWVEETVAQTNARIDAFEAGRAPFGERAKRFYGEDMSGLVEAVEAIDGTPAE